MADQARLPAGSSRHLRTIPEGVRSPINTRSRTRAAVEAATHVSRIPLPIHPLPPVNLACDHRNSTNLQAAPSRHHTGSSHPLIRHNSRLGKRRLQVPGESNSSGCDSVPYKKVAYSRRDKHNQVPHLDYQSGSLDKQKNPSYPTSYENSLPHRNSQRPYYRPGSDPPLDPLLPLPPPPPSTRGGRQKFPQYPGSYATIGGFSDHSRRGYRGGARGGHNVPVDFLNPQPLLHRPDQHYNVQVYPQPLLHRPDQHYNVQVYPLPCPINSGVYHNNRKPNHRPGDSGAPLWNHRGRGPAHQGNRNYQASGPGGDPNNLYFHSLPPPQPRLFPPPDCPVVIPLLQPPPYPLDYQAHRGIRPQFNNPPDPSVYHHLKPGPSRSYRRGPRGGAGPIPGLGRAASGAPSNLSLLPEPEHSSSLRQPGRSRTTGSCASSSRRSSRISKLPLAAGLGGGGAPGRPSTSGAMSGADHDGGVQVHQARGDETGRGTAVTATTMSAPLESTSSENPSDVIQSRIQALLQSHPADPLGIQNILQRSLGVSTSPKAQQLLLGLQAVSDEGQQLQAVIEMCQLLVMGNEDTLVGFPIKQVVPALIQLLRMEHNFDMMNHACRALTYMMEALPRSSAVVVDAIPVFLDKLQVIQCMDVAEQSLTALEMLSRKHSKSILQARGVAACLVYLDFFSINAQRAALAVTANCCQNITAEEFHYVSESIQLLSARLTHQDKKSVESVCLCFSRLVDNVHQDSKLLQDLATHGLLTNVQQLLVVTPPIISTPTFISVVRMLSVMCSNCPELAVQLLKQNIADTLCFLLVGTSESVRDELGLVSRSPQELYEITSLIGELMPRLPNDDIFQVDSLLMKPAGTQPELVTWYWQDDRGVWHQYTATDNRLIEAAHQAGEDDVNLTAAAGNQTYCVDFELMQQINQDSGTSRPVQRRTDPTTIASEPATDSRVGCLQEDSGLALSFIKSLFGVLYEVYSSSAGPAVRHKCLRAILRMVYFANADLLADVLKSQQVSSHIAGMLASSDLKIVVGALQLTDILMQKMADVFGVYFRREGVFYQLQRLSNPEPCQTSPGPSVVPVDNHPAAVISADNISTPSHPDTLATSHSLPTFGSSPSILAPPQSPGQLEDQSSPSQLRISDMLKRKRNVKRSGGSGRKSRSEDDGGGGGAAPYNPGFQTNRQGNNNSSNNNNRNRFAGSSKSASFLASLNPSRWGRSPSNNHFVERSSSKDLVLAQSVSSCLNVNKEKVREWIRDQANKFLVDYFSTESSSPHPALSILTRLTAAIDQLNSQEDHALQALKDIVSVIIESDISPFEVIHSGLVSKLIEYTTWGDKQRHRTFLHVFMGTPLTDSLVSQPTLEAAAPLSSLVSKLNACVNQLEQFPVKVHELPGGTTGQRSGTSAIKFFNTHQLKCNLQRHPNCTNLRNWKGGTVKIDPLALVQAIEKYLVIRGYGRVRDEDETGSEGDNSDSDIDDTLAAVMLSQGSARHRLQLMIGEHVLPYNMTVYQAVRQYGSPDGQETDGEGEVGLGQSSIWLQTHSIWYRALSESEANSLPPSIPHCRASSADSSVVSGQITSSRKSGKSAVIKSSPRKRDDLWNEGVVPQPQSPLLLLLTSTLPDTVCVQDASLETLCLLRHLHAFNRFWGSLYDVSCYCPVLPASEFLNSKLTAKANRQLQDPLVIMTGNLPTWLSQVALACPFLFPFETRQMLLYTVSFDRDRALQRLLDSAPELAGHDSTERVTPRMERRKRTVNRDDLLKQAETVIHDLGTSKALLEIQYQNEVGTGLGPTLEFYSLVSKELQRADLELWRGEIVKVPGGKDGSTTDHVFSSAGLYPAPLPRNAKVNQVTKVKTKFKFLGKLMAKAVMDSRMLDLPLSPVFYHWLLARESNLTSVHLQFVNMDIAKTIYKLEEVVREKGRIQAEEGQTAARLKAALDDLTMDGSRIEDLSLDFTLPGYQGVELRKGGKDLGVGVNNVEEYVKLVVHWSLIEGVQRQMESFREGFDSVFPLAQLQVFYPEELEQVFCGAGNQTWDVKVLMECCRPDHGYTHDSKAIKFLFEVLSGYNGEEQRSFVHFITGSPRLPVGGLRSLNPPLTIVRKTFDPTDNPDDFLPSVMTCVNYLKLPDYSSVDKMKERLRTAALEGQQAFHLS